ncbi:hypothetical protein C8J57DRAFT_1361631, partial [Mycena rebaudengoi]
RGGQCERGMVEGASSLSFRLHFFLVVSTHYGHMLPTSALDPPRADADLERTMSSSTAVSMPTSIRNPPRVRASLARGRRVRSGACHAAGCVDPQGARRGSGNPRAPRATEVGAMTGSAGRTERTRAVSVLSGTGFGVCLELSAYRIYDAPSPLTPSTFAAVY